MGRPSGGAHEISGIKAPIFLHGWVGVVGLGVVGQVGGGGVVGWVVVMGGTHSVDMLPCGCFIETVYENETLRSFMSCL